MRDNFLIRLPAFRGLKFSHILLFLLIMFLWASMISERAAAIPEYSKDLPPSLKNFCNVCHEKASGGPMNSFGNDYKRYGYDIGKVSELDSDGDGFTNGDELEAGTFPGDPKSHPSAGRKKFNTVLLLALVSSLLIVTGLTLRMRRG